MAGEAVKQEPEVVVHVWRGIVSKVLSNVDGLRVEILDEDDLDDDERQQEVKARLEALEQDPNWKEIA